MKTIGKTIDQQPNITNKPESTNAAKIQNSTSGFKRRGKKIWASYDFTQCVWSTWARSSFCRLARIYQGLKMTKSRRFLKLKKTLSRTRPIEA
uniref:Uncharacterized protein n=1 Tax=Lactuca sativa TaxID=4236 RepID=A0A9R1WLI6_LACSA|nr:hypothetical protein LSAT_V11C900485960 [Lactuca sativa]